MNEEINIFKVLDYIRDNSAKYAQAKANRIYLEEYRKSLKSILMIKSASKTSAAQEVEAYSHPEYITHLNALKEAVEAEETLRWMLIAAQAKCEVFRTLQANSRYEAKVV